jgi:hypothetical protein
LPLFVLGSALAGLILERYLSPRLGVAVVVILLVYSLPFALANRTRSLVRWNRVDDVYHPRSVLYFSDQHESLAHDHIAAANAVNLLSCKDIAIDSYVDRPDSELIGSPRSFYVYPLLSMIHADGSTRNVWYRGVHNWSSRYAYRDKTVPCAVVCFDCARAPVKLSEYQRQGWRPSIFGDIVIFDASRLGFNVERTSE